MKRIGKFFKVLGTLGILLGMVSAQAIAQSVSVEATVSETTIYTGERISLSIEISGDFNNISRPELPQLDGFRLLSSTPSTSRSYSYVNGKSSTSYTYSYYMIAQQEGNHQIPPVSISIDGTEYNTEPLQVRIVNRNSSASSEEDSRPDIFLQLQVSDEQPVTGQQVVTDVILYFKDGLEVSSYQPIPGWKAEGFWKEELRNTDRPQATSTIIEGVRYRKARLLQFSLFPTKTGNLEISPYEIVVNVRSTRSRNDSFSSFFGGFGNNQRQIELESDPVSLNVQALPADDEVNYIGAVGSFSISRSINSESIRAGESVEITTQVEGTGNIPLISKPDYDLPEGMEVYDPQETSDLNRRNHEISGSKSFTDVVIARSPGSYTIPEKEVAYYDPTSGGYVEQTLPALSFEVMPNNNTIANAERDGSINISPVTGLASWSTPTTRRLTSYWWFWAGLILPLLILAGAFWRKSYLQKLETDQGFARSKVAAEKAEERLEQAISLSEGGDIKQAYSMLQKAITGFISDKLNMPEAGLSNSHYVEALEEQAVDKELVQNIRMLLEKCASISYAPSTTHSYLKSHVGLAQSTLEKLKKVL